MTPMNDRRVVITGCGAVTPIGIGKEEFWNALERGENGIDYITLFDTEKHTTKIAGEVKNFAPENWLDKKEVRRTDRVLHFAAAGADLAVKDAGLDVEKLDKEMFGVYVGSGEGGISTIEENFRLLYEKGPSRVSPFMVPMMITNMPAGYIAIRLGAKGPNMAVVTACASSTHSMGEAYNCIVRGDADVMITGGVEAAISPLATAGFSSLKALSGRNDDPKHASRPFDAGRDGFVIGEGAGILVLEELEHAKARGAKIYAEVVGYGANCDAYHFTAPAPGGAGGAECMRLALRDAELAPEKIGYINAHGTSTHLNDSCETAAIKAVFGDYAYQLRISSTKSMTGHLLGAAGGVEGVFTALALRDGYLPATIGLKVPDPECDLNYLPNEGVEEQVEYALSDSLGFGGHNACVIFKRWEG